MSDFRVYQIGDVQARSVVVIVTAGGIFTPYLLASKEGQGRGHDIEPSPGAERRPDEINDAVIACVADELHSSVGLSERERPDRAEQPRYMLRSLASFILSSFLSR